MIRRRVTLVLLTLMLIAVTTTACSGGGTSATPTPIKPNATVLARFSETPLPASPVLPSSTPTPTPTYTSAPRTTSTPTPKLLSPTPLPTPLTPLANATSAATLTPTATTLLDNLTTLVLQPDDVPRGLVADPTRSGEQSNIDVADGDPDRLQQLKNWGRQSGYTAAYQATTNPPNGEVSLLSSTTALFDNDAGAQAAWADAVQRIQASEFPFAATSEAPRYSDNSTVLVYNDKQSGIATYVFLAVSGPLVSQITIVGKGIDATDIYPLASIVAARMSQSAQ